MKNKEVTNLDYQIKRAVKKLRSISRQMQSYDEYSDKAVSAQKVLIKYARMK